MKMNMQMWQKILEANNSKTSSASPQLAKIIKAAGLDRFLKVISKPSYELVLPTLAIALTKIDLEETPRLKEIFFREFAALPNYQKENVCKHMLNPNRQHINGETAYYVENMLETPSIYDVFLYRSHISQEKLNKAVNFIIKDVLLTISKEDFQNKGSVHLGKVMSDETADNLLTLMELSEITEENIKSLATVTTKSPIIKSRLKKIFGEDINTSILETKSTAAHIVSVDISTESLLILESLDSSSLYYAQKFISYMIDDLVKIEKVEKIESGKFNCVQFLAYDNESHTEALIIIKLLTDWIETNKEEIIKNVKEVTLKGASPRDVQTAAQDLSSRLSLLFKIDKSLPPRLSPDNHRSLKI